MLSGTELLIAGLFIVVLLVMSVIDIAFSAVNKISMRRLVDSPNAKAAPSLVTLLETRPEVLMSIHVVIQLLLVSGAVLLFGVFQRREIPYVGGALGTILVMVFVVLIFRHLVPRILTMMMISVWSRDFLSCANRSFRIGISFNPGMPVIDVDSASVMIPPRMFVSPSANRISC